MDKNLNHTEHKTPVLENIFIWDQDKDQTYTNEYLPIQQNAQLASHLLTFSKSPGKHFTMHEGLEKGAVLTLTPKIQERMSFPRVNDNNDNKLCKMHLNGGELHLKHENASFDSSIFFGVNGDLDLLLQNEAKLVINNFSSTNFGKYCITKLKDTSSIEISDTEHQSIIDISSAIHLEDDSSIILNAYNIFSKNTFNCSGSAELNIKASFYEIELANFNIADSAKISVLNRNDNIPVFDFGTVDVNHPVYNGNPYKEGLFNLTKKIGFFIYNPTIEFSATSFSDLHLELLLANKIIKTNNKIKLKQRSLGGCKYLISL